MKTKRPLAPRGGNDRVYTPPELAKAIVQHFQPTGRILDPCAGPLGRQAFVYAIEERTRKTPAWCEIDEDRDFFNHHVSAEWIITNPPWSKFRPFLNKAMTIADDIVFVSLLNAWFMRARVRDMRAAGFGMKEALFLDTPPKPWPQTGFQLAAVHIRRGWIGNCRFTFLEKMPPETGVTGAFPAGDAGEETNPIFVGRKNLEKITNFAGDAGKKG